MEEIIKKIEALDNKYKEHITGLNLQISAMSSQYSALSMQYSLLLARVDVLESKEGELPDVNFNPAQDVPDWAAKPNQTNTAARHEAMNKPPKWEAKPGDENDPTALG